MSELGGEQGAFSCGPALSDRVQRRPLIADYNPTQLLCKAAWERVEGCGCCRVQTKPIAAAVVVELTILAIVVQHALPVLTELRASAH
jgi:hypothetical protein